MLYADLFRYVHPGKKLKTPQLPYQIFIAKKDTSINFQRFIHIFIIYEVRKKRIFYIMKNAFNFKFNIRIYNCDSRNLTYALKIALL